MPDFSVENKLVLTMIGTGSAILLVMTWAATCRAFPGIVRAAAVFVPLSAVLVASSVLRLESMSGDLFPHFAWRWTPKPHARLTALQTTLTALPATPARPHRAESEPAAGDYPGFLGPRRDARCDDVSLDADWNARPPVLRWRQEIGAGWGAFAIVGSRAFTHEMRGSRELVACYELQTGRPVWMSHDVDDASVWGFVSAISGDGPRDTPTIAGGCVYTMGSTGILVCRDAATGQRHWSRAVLVEHGATNTEWGHASSPLVWKDLVVVTGGGKQGPALLAYDRITGSPRWTGGNGGAMYHSYASPMLVRLADTEQIVCYDNDGTFAVDPQNGRLLWHHAWPWSGGKNFPKCVQPVVVGANRLLISGSYFSGSAVIEVQRGAAGALLPTTLWENRNLRSKFSTMVVHEGHIYGLDDRILTCLNAQTGLRCWKAGRYGHGQLLQTRKHLLVVGESGELALIEPRREKYVELARISALSGQTWNNPALAGNVLLLRNDREAACYELGAQE